MTISFVTILGWFVGGDYRRKVSAAVCARFISIVSCRGERVCGCATAAAVSLLRAAREAGVLYDPHAAATRQCEIGCRACCAQPGWSTRMTHVISSPLFHYFPLLSSSRFHPFEPICTTAFFCRENGRSRNFSVRSSCREHTFPARE